MSGPKAGLGRVERKGETARLFSRSLPGPLPPFLTPHTAILEPDFRNRVFQTLSETAISVPHSAAVLQAWPLCGPKLGPRNAPHGACRLIASLAPDWAKARFSRCTPWCPRLVLVVRDGGWVKKNDQASPIYQGPCGGGMVGSSTWRSTGEEPCG